MAKTSQSLRKYLESRKKLNKDLASLQYKNPRHFIEVDYIYPLIIKSSNNPEFTKVEKLYNKTTSELEKEIETNLQKGKLKRWLRQCYLDYKRDLDFYENDYTKFQFFDKNVNPLEKKDVTEEIFIVELCRYFNLDLTIVVEIMYEIDHNKEKSVFEIAEKVFKDFKHLIDIKIFVVLIEFNQNNIAPTEIFLRNCLRTANDKDFLSPQKSSTSSSMKIIKDPYNNGYKFTRENSVSHFTTSNDQQIIATKGPGNVIYVEYNGQQSIAKAGIKNITYLKKIEKKGQEKLLHDICVIKQEVTLHQKSGKIHFKYGDIEIHNLLDPTGLIQFDYTFYSRKATQARKVLSNILSTTTKKIEEQHLSDLLFVREKYRDMLVEMRKGPYAYDVPICNIFRAVKENISPSSNNELNEELIKLEVLLEKQYCNYYEILPCLEKIEVLKQKIDMKEQSKQKTQTRPPQNNAVHPIVPLYQSKGENKDKEESKAIRKFNPSL